MVWVGLGASFYFVPYTSGLLRCCRVFFGGANSASPPPSLCGVSLADWSAGAVEPCDTVIIATGFEAAHGRWLDPGLLREGAEAGVHMVGFNNGRYTKA